jgi:hypothetical protein
MNELALVRVVRLAAPERDVTGTDGATRQPRIGDVGTVVFVLEPGAAYTVECIDDDGMTAWLADFDAHELEPVPLSS